MALSPLEVIEKAYKAETDAAWKAMSQRFDRAMAKREKQRAAYFGLTITKPKKVKKP